MPKNYAPLPPACPERSGYSRVPPHGKLFEHDSTERRTSRHTRERDTPRVERPRIGGFLYDRLLCAVSPSSKKSLPSLGNKTLHVPRNKRSASFQIVSTAATTHEGVSEGPPQRRLLCDFCWSSFVGVVRRRKFRVAWLACLRPPLLVLQCLLLLLCCAVAVLPSSPRTLRPPVPPPTRLTGHQGRLRVGEQTHHLC